MKKQSNLHFLFLLLIFGFCCNFSYAQSQIYVSASTIKTTPVHPLLNQLTNYELFQINSQQLWQSARNKGGQPFHLNLQLGKNHHWEFVLEPAKVHGNDFKFITNTGAVIEVEKNITYKGYLKNQAQTKVRLTISKNQIAGLFFDEEGTAFETLKMPSNSEQNQILVFYKSRQLPKNETLCGHQTPHTQKNTPLTNEINHPTFSPIPSEFNQNFNRNINQNNTYCPKLGVVLDWQGLNVAGSEANFNTDLQTMINIVNGYYDDFSVQYKLNPIHVITSSPNPWTDAPGNQSQLTENFANWAFPNLMPNDYNCALLYTGTDMNGIGYAYLGQMCTDDAFRYGEIDYLYEQPISQKANLTAHELGHLWGANHVGFSETHIMSPSIFDGTLEWSSTSFNVISNAVNNEFNACLPACTNINVNWVNPVAAQIFTNLDPITLEATASDAESTITQIEFFVNGNSVGTDNTAPYTTSWTPPGFGTYTLIATATNSINEEASSTIVIEVQDGNLVQINVQVSSGSDDAEEDTNDGIVNLTSSDLELVEDGSTPQEVGIRFASVDVPSGVTITNAYVQFTVDNTDGDATSLHIYAEEHDNPPTFSNIDFNVSSRDKTAISVPWSPTAWNTSGVAGSDQQTPNLRPLMQSIINRSGWAANNAIVLIFTGTGERTAHSYNGDAPNAPVLHITYSLEPIDCSPHTDADFDGFCSDVDCDDNNPAIHPGAVEICDGLDNNCNEQTDENTCNYCIPVHDGSENELITNVLVGNINNSSNGWTTATPGYSDYTHLSTTVEPNANYDITVIPNYSWNDSRLGIWADWNRNALFEANEEIASIGSEGPWMTQFSPPANAVSGLTRLRIRLQYGPNYTPDPCAHSGFFSGETEDYTLMVNNPLSLAAITLSAFREKDNSVTLYWQVQGETSSTLYEIQRSSDGNDFDAINKIEGSFQTDYTFQDKAARQWQQELFYRIKAIELDNIQFSPIVSVTALSSNIDFPILNITPNPFEEALTIHVSMPSSKNISLDIFNPVGQHITSLINEELEEGQHFIHWEGKNNNGIKLPSGVYYIRLSDGQEQFIEKVVKY